MTKYKLLKDIVTMDLRAKAGDIGVEIYQEVSNYDEACKVWFDNGRYFFYLSKIKQFPDWFEEVKEEQPKEWEILRVKHKERKTHWNKSVWSVGDWQQKVLDRLSDFELISIKRLSDGEVFTIGDTVLYDEDGDRNKIRIKWAIDHFYVRNDGVMLARSKDGSNVEAIDNNCYP